MALTYSEMIPLGTKAPEFSLQGIDGKTYSLKDFKGKKALAVLFICQHCPYVQAIEERLSKLAREFTPRGVQFVGICSNDVVNYPEDDREHLLAQAQRAGFEFPYLVDETQRVAKAYDAVCTPDIYLFDSEFKLVYRGRLDDSWKDPTKVTRQDLKDALEATISGKPLSSDQKPSMGCNIKWKTA